MTRLALAVLIALAACGHRGDAGTREAPAEAVEHDHARQDGDAGPSTLHIDAEMLRDLRITTTAATVRPAGERVTALGDLEVDQDAYAEIAAPMPARVVKVLVKPGDAVTAGQTVVVLHSPELGKARAEYQAARTRAGVAAQAMARKRELAADKLITGRELQEAEAASISAEADVTVASAALRAFGSATDPGGDGSSFALASPVKGTVIDRQVVLGQLADPSRTLLRVGDLSTLWLVAHVFERDAVRVPVGGKASVALAAMPGKPVDATVALIGREVETASRTVAVRLDVANPTGELRPGMSATVSLPLGDAAGTVVVVPLASVQRVGDGWAVFVPRGPADFAIRPVGRGRELGNEVELLSGLAAGETVVVEGAFLLKAEADKARGEGGEEE